MTTPSFSADEPKTPAFVAKKSKDPVFTVPEAEGMFPPGLALDVTVQEVVDALQTTLAVHDSAGVATLIQALAVISTQLSGTLNVHPDAVPDVSALAKDATLAAGNALLNSLLTALGQLTLEATQQIASANIAEIAHDAFVGQRPGGWLPYSKNVLNDAMNVTILSGTTGASSFWGNNGAYPVWYGTGGPNSVDARDALIETSQMRFNQTRLGRWVIT